MENKTGRAVGHERYDKLITREILFRSLELRRTVDKVKKVQSMFEATDRRQYPRRSEKVTLKKLIVRC